MSSSANSGASSSQKSRGGSSTHSNNSSRHQPYSYGSAMTNQEREKYIEEFKYPHCDEMAVKYERMTKIGQGTFGEVFKARERQNPTKFVALKKVLMENEKEGFPITALREIRILQLLKHENIVNLIEICRTKAQQHTRYRSTFYLVFDFCEHDLAGLLSNTQVAFSLAEIKMVLKQMFDGLFYIHSNKILHRDMKAANILITKSGVLKLADFGLARAFSISKNGQPNRFTNRVVTLWYRPPELLLGERNYTTAVDLWGAGCIMAEMWTRSPILQGGSEQAQLKLISQLCGTICPAVWPGVENLEMYRRMELPEQRRKKLIKLANPKGVIKSENGKVILTPKELDQKIEFQTAVIDRMKFVAKDPYACDLLDKLFTLDPSKRIDADNALMHNFFWSDPMPSDLAGMLSNHTQSMFEFLTPPRRSQHMRQSQASRQATLLPARARTEDSTYHERVF